MITHANGHDLYYITRGRGQPLLFVHGFPLTGEMWNPIVERLSNRWTCIVPDLRGHGRSAISDDVSMADFADDLAGLLDAIGERRAVAFVGLSMGAYTAFDSFPRPRPRLRPLPPATPGPPADSPETRAKREVLAAAVLKDGSKAAADGMIGTLFGPAASPELKAHWHAI